MKKREIVTTGKIDSTGNLRMYMGELTEFFQKWKNEKVIVKIEVVRKDVSKPLLAYYFKYVIPTFKIGFWNMGERLTDEQTEKKLRELSPVMYVENVDDNGNYSYELKRVTDISNAEIIEHIEFLKQLAAEEFNIFINDPNTF